MILRLSDKKSNIRDKINMNEILQIIKIVW